MPWLSNAPRKRLNAPAPVPDVDALRLAALQASWQRDRWVARRRVAMRWALWYAGKYGLQVLLALVVAAFVWLRVIPELTAPTEPVAVAPAPAPTPTQAPTATSPTPEPAQTPAPEAAPPANPDETDPPLRLEREWKAVSARHVSVQPDDSPAPPLKSDNALHSQEP